MTRTAKATSEEMSLEEMLKTIEELKSKLDAKEKEVDDLKKKEEGYLVWTSNPLYSGRTLMVQFTDGMAFIPHDRVYKDLPAKDGMPSAQRMAELLKNDYGYDYKFFTKDDMDGLNQMITARAKERMEIELKVGTQAQMLEKLIQSHRM